MRRDLKVSLLWFSPNLALYKLNFKLSILFILFCVLVKFGLLNKFKWQLFEEQVDLEEKECFIELSLSLEKSESLCIYIIVFFDFFFNF